MASPTGPISPKRGLRWPCWSATPTWRRHGQPRVAQRLVVLQLFLRIEPASTGNHTRPRATTARSAGCLFRGGATFMRNGDYFGNYSDHDRHYREMARHSKRDANAYDRYAADTSLQTKLIRPYLMRTPPDPTSMKPRDLRDLLEFARSFMDLGEEKLLDTIKFWTASVGDYLNEYFETDVIKAHMAGSGIIGTAHWGSIPRHCLRSSPPLHGRCGWQCGRLGFCTRRNGRHCQCAVQGVPVLWWRDYL